MTPFMWRVAELVGAETDDMPEVHTSPSVFRSVSEGADRQGEMRALAEQLVAEANAVLATSSEALTLDDELEPDSLSFVIGMAGRQARITTRIADKRSFGQLIGEGTDGTEPQELADDALEELILLLVAESGLKEEHRAV